MNGEDVIGPMRLPDLRSPAHQLLARLLQRIHSGRLELRWPGQPPMLLGQADAPHADLRLHRPARLLRRVLLHGAVGFAEGYIAGDWDSRNLTALLRLLLANRDRLEAPRLGAAGAAWNRLRHGLRLNSRRGSRRNIRAHYDLGNDFYRLWLDPSLSYSAALFENPLQARFDELEAAQQRKYTRMLDQLDARPGQHLLEIGCGWGGLAIAAAQRGLRVTGITLSREQLIHARERVRRLGLTDRIELRLQDYRELQGQYDHIVSIEMLEAVGERYWPLYFDTLQRSLKPGGRAALQVITIDESRFEHYRRRPDFIQLHIFPGGMLPTVSILQEQAMASGLQWAQCDRFGAHYARTCALWNERFGERSQALTKLGYDAAFQRRWQYYLAYCETGFDAGVIDLVQLALHKPG